MYVLYARINWSSPFSGATDTPVLNFLWCPLRISKPECTALFMLSRGACVTHSLRFTSGVTPADLLAASMAAKPIISTYLWERIGGAWNWDLLCCRWMLDQLNYASWANLHKLTLKARDRILILSAEISKVPAGCQCFFAKFCQKPDGIKEILVHRWGHVPKKCHVYYHMHWQIHGGH